MKLFLISHPSVIEKEHDVIHRLFENGLDYLHVRKPDWTKEELENFLREISPAYLRKTVIHSHYSLIGKYNLRGIHLPERVRNESETEGILRTAKSKRLSVSTSIHSLEDLKECNRFSYVLTSPVFDSISKEGYKSAIDIQTLKSVKERENVKCQVVGLGGIDDSNIIRLLASGFDGAAVHGAIWQSFEENDIDKPVEILRKIKSALSKAIAN